MKAKLTTHMCIDIACGFQVTDHRFRDGMKCPKCSGSIHSFHPADKRGDEPFDRAPSDESPKLSLLERS